MHKSNLSLQEFQLQLQALRLENLAPVYTLSSSDDFLLQLALKHFKKHLDLKHPTFNEHEFKGNQVNLKEILTLAKSLPWMSLKRWIHLQDGQNLGEKAVEDLLLYIKEPNPSTILCLSFTKLDKRTKFANEIRKLTRFMEILPPKPYELPLWITDHATSKKIQITKEAALLLSEAVGPNLQYLDVLLEQLGTYSLKAKTETPCIDAEAVKELISASRKESIFALTTALANRERKTATIFLLKALKQGEPPLSLLHMLSRQIRLLLYTKLYLAEEPPGTSEIKALNLSTALNVQTFVATNLLKESQNFTQKELEQALTHCLETDKQLKTTGLKPLNLLMNLLLLILA